MVFLFERCLGWRTPLPRFVVCLALVVFSTDMRAAPSRSARVDVNAIVQRWLQASRADFDAATQFGYHERIHDDDGTRTYEVILLDGSPFKRLVSVNDHALSGEAAEKERRRLEEATVKRSGESANERAERIADYKKDYDRAHRILEQMPRAFQYTLQATRPAGAYTAYVLRAVPRKGYDPPSTEAEVLTGMQGQFWIDSNSDQLIRGVARVLKPVTIEGFLATVQPGTEFELEQKPIAPHLWLPTHFQIRSHSRVLFFFHHHIDEERTFFSYRREPSAAPDGHAS